MTHNRFDREDVYNNSSSCSIAFPEGIYSYELIKFTVIALVDFSLQNMVRNSNLSGICFLVDRDNGWFITNKHIVSANYVQRVFVMFGEGIDLTARLVYEDPEHDFSIISVNPKEIPQTLILSFFSSKLPKIGDDVYLAAHTNSESCFQYKSGKIIDIQSKGSFSSQVFVANFSILQGDSGSPVYNKEGLVLGIAFATNNEFMAILDSRYILDALDDIKSNMVPSRHSSGALFEYCDLEKMFRFSLVPAEALRQYEYLSGTQKGICVKRVFLDYGNELEVGDIVWKINGQFLNPDLYYLQKIINLNDNIMIDVFRFNKSMSYYTKTFDITKFQIDKILFIDGTIFYQAGTHTTLVFGVDPFSLFAKTISSESAFSQVSMSSIIKVHNITINSFDDFFNALPHLITMQNFALQKINHMVNIGFNQQMSFHKDIEFAYMHIDNATEIRLLQYIDDAWVSSNLFFDCISYE